MIGWAELFFHLIQKRARSDQISAIDVLQPLRTATLMLNKPELSKTSMLSTVD